MPIESTNYLPSLASRRAWDNPKLAEWNELEVVIRTRTSTSKRGRILCATINSILVLANLYLIMENLL